MSFFRKKIPTWFEIGLIEVSPIPEKLANASFSIHWKRGSKGSGKTKAAVATDRVVRFNEVLSFQGSIMQEKNGVCKNKPLDFTVYWNNESGKNPTFMGSAEMDLGELYYGKGETTYFDLPLHKSVNLPLAKIKIRAIATDPKKDVTDSHHFTLVEDDEESLMGDGRTSPLRSPRPDQSSMEATYRLENEQLRKQVEELQEELLKLQEQKGAVEERDTLLLKVRSLEAANEGREDSSDVDERLAALRAQMEKEKKEAVEAERARIDEDLNEIAKEYKKLMEEAAKKAVQDVWTKLEKEKEGK